MERGLGRRMGMLLKYCLATALALSLWLSSGRPTEAQGVKLPTGKTLTEPAPGFVGRTNSYPATIAVSPDHRYAAFLNEGYGTEQDELRQSIAILDLRTNQLRDFPDNRLRGDERSTLASYFIGLAFSSDGKHLYASMSSVPESGIAMYKFDQGAIIAERFLAIPPQPLATGKSVTFDLGNARQGTAPPYPAGFAVMPTPTGDELLIADNLSDNVILLDSSSGRMVKAFDVSTSRYVPSAFPYTVITNRRSDKAWVSLWNECAVVELELKTGTIGRRFALSAPLERTASGSHPTATLLSADENTLYVSLSNASTTSSDGVATIDLVTGTRGRFYRVALSGENEPGASPIGLALSPMGTRLYVTSASLNAVAVFEVKVDERPAQYLAEARPMGLVPTEWYPSALAVVGGDLLIASAKGTSSGPNGRKALYQSGRHPSLHPYIATLVGGSVQRLSLANIEQQLADYTRLVDRNNLPRQGPYEFHFAGGANPIRHVIYIPKENRTYDQILGDLGAGDGDPSLTMYGASITPNEHKLALRFGVLDNFYDSGEVSANGHLWSIGSATSDYMEKIWPILYRGSKRPEDYGNALDRDEPEADDPGTGFLWDNLAQHGLSYRIYGEMLESVWCKSEKASSHREGKPSGASAKCPSSEIRKGDSLPSNVGSPGGGPSPWPWPVPRIKELRPAKAGQRNHFDPLYPNFALDYPDQLRADEFLREFAQFVQARGTTKELPQFVLLYLPNDHTAGTRAGMPAPQASVADNDLAVGRVVEAVSHSPYWDDTVIFVVEDDAQNGADHVDAHRSIALEISKYSLHAERPVVDHHFYTTISMVRTMESLLGLPPMNIFDGHAPLMVPLLAAEGIQPSYQADDSNLRNGLIYRVNEKGAAGARESAGMDFSRPDAADSTTLNAILWQNAMEYAAKAQP